MSLPLVVGNWKMHGTQSESFKLARQIVRGLKKESVHVEVVLAPPYTAIQNVKKAIRQSGVKLAAQNSHWEDAGPFTGEVSAAMLRDIGCEFVILGHSERRHLFHETDQSIAKKMSAALRHGLRPILCVGETLSERRSGLTTRVISRQLRIALKGVRKSVIEKIEVAYEPVWAIGTGQNATADQVNQVHGWIRKFLARSFGKTRGRDVRILYGGSVRPDNAEALARTPEVNGLLVGGASLKAETFLPIIRSCASTVW
ncbi:MAG TPA: triose-phosphate isomerase [Candidatus Binatia bacterium]|nr:triose-phosphate isomerase [Candidatus Binatia bacterium]